MTVTGIWWILVPVLAAGAGVLARRLQRRAASPMTSTPADQ
jgi:hypothetical protein